METHSQKLEKFLSTMQNGGDIHIKESHKGKFTEWANRHGYSMSEAIQHGKSNDNPNVRKMATFADNASRWKHEDGGDVDQEMIQQIITLLQQTKDPQKVVQILVQNGVSQQDAQMEVQQAVAYLQNPQEQQFDDGGMISITQNGKLDNLNYGDLSSVKNAWRNVLYNTSFDTDQGFNMPMPYLKNALQETGKGLNTVMLGANALTGSMSPINYLPDTSKLKAFVGLASGLSGAALGYEKLFAKSKDLTPHYVSQWEKFKPASNRMSMTLSPEEVAQKQKFAEENIVPKENSITGLIGQSAFEYGGELDEYPDGGPISSMNENERMQYLFGNGLYGKYIASNGMNPYYDNQPTYNHPERYKFEQKQFHELSAAELFQQRNYGKAIASNGFNPYYQDRPAEYPFSNKNAINNDPVLPSNTPAQQEQLKFPNVKQTQHSTYGDPLGTLVAANAVNGLGMMNNYLDATKYEQDYKKLMREANNSNNISPINPNNPFGLYTPNAGPASNFALVRNGAIQDFGTNQFMAEYGGEFSLGEEYEIDDKEIERLRSLGYDFDIID